MIRELLVVSLAVLAVSSSCAPPSSSSSASSTGSDSSADPAASLPAPSRKPKLGSFGVELNGIDARTKPGDDFYGFASGGWMKDTRIPADRSRWGMFDALRDDSEANVRTIIEEERARAKHPSGSAIQKVTDLYSAYLDTAAIDRKGFAPAKPALDLIAAAKTPSDIVKLMGRPELPVETPIAMGVTLDEKDPNRWVLAVQQSGLGLPEREFYLNDAPQFRDIRAKYEAHIARVLSMIGNENAGADAAAIVALETQIAERHWPIAERRDRDKTYNPRTIAELEKEAPAFPWKDYLEAQGFANETSVIVAEMTAIPELARLFESTPVATWKAYLTYHFLRASAGVLPSQLDAEVFDFTGRTLDGRPQQRERWKRAVSAVNGALGDAVGQLYVARYFQPEAKAAMDRLVENVRSAYAARIEAVEWMTPETKRAALEKLAAFRPKIGYPAKWKDYGGLEVVAGDAYGNALRARVWHHEYMRAKLGKPSDRDEWFITPQTVNAYYNPVFNEIVFPAAILQPPFFDPNADPAVNYGGIGGVIGHEMGHGFDDQGAKSDAHGILRTWWSPTDVAAFKKRTDALAEQYARFEPLPGINVNGRLTLGENIGDLGGLAVAQEAYRLSLGGQPAPVIDTYTGDQRFFLGWAQVWRSLYREEALRNQVLTDPHSPAMYRVNGVVRNLDSWYRAFDVKEGDALYLRPEERVRIW